MAPSKYLHFFLSAAVLALVLFPLALSSQTSLRDRMPASPTYGLPGQDTLNWGVSFEGAVDGCGAGTGMFFYSADRVRYVMPVYSGSPDKYGGFLGGSTPDNRRYYLDVLSGDCIYRLSIEKLVKVDGVFRPVDLRHGSQVAPGESLPP